MHAPKVEATWPLYGNKQSFLQSYVVFPLMESEVL